MKIITIGNQKGGVGKSTIACNLAVQAVTGDRRTLLIDADLEASSMDFRAIRAEKENLPQFSAVAIIKDTIHHDVRSFNDFDVALIDVGGFDGKVFRSAIMAADLFLIPVLPSLYDVWSTQETIEILKEIQA
ncbi:MAG TPA: AAA family ATPase, partial [Syntrophales bacterium]|nr:AAA family ATPase [Syntrophales bacterium]